METLILVGQWGLIEQRDGGPGKRQVLTGQGGGRVEEHDAKPLKSLKN